MSGDEKGTAAIVGFFFVVVGLVRVRGEVRGWFLLVGFFFLNGLVRVTG